MIVHIKKETVPAYQCQKTQSATQDTQMETEINRNSLHMRSPIFF